MMSLTPTRITMLETFCQSAILDARTERIEWFWTKDISSARMRGSALVRHGSLDSQDLRASASRPAPAAQPNPSAGYKRPYKSDSVGSPSGSSGKAIPKKPIPKPAPKPAPKPDP